MLKYAGKIKERKQDIFFQDIHIPLNKIDEINEKLLEYKETAKILTGPGYNADMIVLKLDNSIEDPSRDIDEFKKYYASILKDII